VYRYSFNGKENNRDVKGDGNQIYYGARIIGRGHDNLSNNANTVQAAGQIKLFNGQIKAINNNSGHYLPTPSETANFGQVFKNAGVNVSGVKLQTYTSGSRTPIATTRIE